MKGSKMKVEKRKSLKEINKTLQEDIELLPNEYRQQLKLSMEDLETFTSEHEQMMKGLPKLMLFMLALIVIFASLFGSFGYYSVQLEETIVEKNNIIRQYQYRDSIFSLLLDRNDSAEYLYYRLHNGKPVTYHQLEHQYDSLQTRCYDLQNENAYKQDVLELLHQLYPYEVMEKDEKLIVSGPNYKEQLNRVNAQKDSINLLWMKTRNDFEVMRLRYELITKHYPIKVEQDGNKYRVEASTIDSALMLLPYYREKLTFDPVTQNWVIAFTREEKMVTVEPESNKRNKK